MLTMRQRLQETRIQAVADALRVSGNNRIRAARLLDINRSDFYRHLKRYGFPISKPREGNWGD